MRKVTQTAEFTAGDICSQEIRNKEHAQERGRQSRRPKIAIEPRPIASAPGAWSVSMEWRCFDVIVSVLVLMVAFLPSLLVCILIRLTSRGPIFFQQKRVGYGGSLFTLFKFRTMQVAETAIGPCLTRDGDP